MQQQPVYDSIVIPCGAERKDMDEALKKAGNWMNEVREKALKGKKGHEIQDFTFSHSFSPSVSIGPIHGGEPKQFLTVLVSYFIFSQIS